VALKLAAGDARLSDEELRKGTGRSSQGENEDGNGRARLESFSEREAGSVLVDAIECCESLRREQGF